MGPAVGENTPLTDILSAVLECVHMYIILSEG